MIKPPQATLKATPKFASAKAEQDYGESQDWPRVGEFAVAIGAVARSVLGTVSISVCEAVG
jgi:hypothetical protein